jgi:quercetin dioxygenase-like cupin family protein
MWKQGLKSLTALAVAIILAGCALWAQSAAPTALPLEKESHHHLLLENSAFRVFRLVLKPGESTSPHKHPGFYASIAIHGGDLSTEVKGRKPVPSMLSDGELRTSKGGFTLVEHNVGKTTIEILIVEPASHPGLNVEQFGEAMLSFRYHDAVVGTLFENPPLRAYEMTLASGGRTERHLEQYNRLMIALTDVYLKDKTEGRDETEIRINEGDISWLAGGVVDEFTNSGSQPAHFIVVESNR